MKWNSLFRRFRHNFPREHFHWRDAPEVWWTYGIVVARLFSVRLFFHLIKTIRCNSFQIENANFPSPLKSFNDFKICCFYLSNFCHRKIVIAKDLPSDINTPFFCTLFIRRDRKLKKWKKIGVRICSSKCSFLSLKFGFRLNSSFILFNLAWYFPF